MNKVQVLAAVGIAVAMSTAANARQAEVKSFSGPSAAFQLIEPRLREASAVIPIPAAEQGDPVDLGSEFALLASEPPVSTVSSRLANLKVPGWMRGGATALMPNVNVPAYTSISLANCGSAQYAPHPSLNASQELRRYRYFPQVAAAACGAGVPVELFDALIIQESRYNPLALSSKGASGLTQLMPGTARSLGVFDRWSVSQNLSGGARYLRKQLDTFGNWALALGAYNAGPGNVAKYRGLPPFRETRGYVRTILSSANSYQLSRRGVGVGSLGPRRGVMLASFTR